MSAPMVEIRDVAFAYPGGRPVLDGVSLEVRSGSCLCLMGPNGCGKSTLLDCVLGVNRPERGAVLVQGEAVASLAPREMARRAAYVPQVHEPSFPYTVLHVAAMGAAARTGGLGGPDSEEAAQARAALERCGIGHLADRPASALSGGEVQMVMLARALVQDCPLVVMDEPTAHLDLRNELLFLEKTASLVREEGVTVVMATHSPNQAFHLADAGVSVEVALLASGCVRRRGTPEEVLDAAAMAEVFGVEAALWRGTGADEGLSQLVLRRTLARKEDGR